MQRHGTHALKFTIRERFYKLEEGSFNEILAAEI
jgi:hypothetical protein